MIGDWVNHLRFDDGIGGRQFTRDRWGSITMECGLCLYSLVRTLQPEYTIETGCGLSTIFIAAAHKENGLGGKHLAVDSHAQQVHRTWCMLDDAALEGSILAIVCSDMKFPPATEEVEAMMRTFDAGIAYAPDTPVLVRMVGKRTFGFAWIDSDHSYDHISYEMDVIAPAIAQNGIIAAHDSLCEDHTKQAYLDGAAKFGLKHVMIPTRRGCDLMVKN